MNLAITGQNARFCLLVELPILRHKFACDLHAFMQENALIFSQGLTGLTR